jgi:hypothetical protein
MRQRAYQRNGKMKKNFHFGTKGKKAWLLALSLLCFCTTAVAQTTYTSFQSGPWNNTSTWLPAGVPGSGTNDAVVIDAGHTVTLDVSPTNTLASVTVNSNGTPSSMTMWRRARLKPECNRKFFRENNPTSQRDYDTPAAA